MLHTLSYRPSRSHCCALLSSKLALSISSALLSNRLECIAKRSVNKPGNNAQGIVRHTCVLLLSPAQSRSPRLNRSRALKVIGQGREKGSSRLTLGRVLRLFRSGHSYRTCRQRRVEFLLNSYFSGQRSCQSRMTKESNRSAEGNVM